MMVLLKKEPTGYKWHVGLAVEVRNTSQLACPLGARQILHLPYSLAAVPGKIGITHRRECMHQTPLAYERQPGESDRAFAAFCCYRDLGPKRSLDEVGKRLYGDHTRRKRGSTGRVREWSAKWNWRERGAAWDAHLDRQTCESQEQARREMGERHARVAVALQEKAIQRLKAMKLEELSSADLLRYAIEAAKLERQPEAVEYASKIGRLPKRTGRPFPA